jgi:tetratricopeptide (TPR) repeat protein
MNPAEREAWLRGCDVEHDNFRAAATRLIAAGDAEWALRLGAALFRFWEQRDHLTEGREALDRVLSMPGNRTPTRLRARALYGAAILADIQGDLAHGKHICDEACAIYRQFGDVQGLATTLTAMAWQAQRRGEGTMAMSLFGEAVRLWEQLHDDAAVDMARSNMANAAKAQGQIDEARGLLEMVVASSQQRGDVRSFASALNGLGDVVASQGDNAAARRYHHDSLLHYRRIDDRWGIARVLTDLADLDLQAEDYAAADGAIREAVQAYRDLGHQRGLVRQLEWLAWCSSCQSRDEMAVMLAGASSAIRQRIGTPAKPAERDKVDQAMARARAHLGHDAYERAWRRGLDAPLDDLLRLETPARP